MNKIYYKIVQKKGNEIFTLFHGIAGTRKLPIDKWLKAEMKANVMDGHGTKYTCGIHVIDGLEEARKYLGRFRKDDRVIVECVVNGVVWPKLHSRNRVYLVEQVKILNNGNIYYNNR